MIELSGKRIWWNVNKNYSLMIIMNDGGVELTYIYNSSGNNQETIEHVVYDWY